MSWRYICIHGHFYQPPRENPWLETVELQDSAAPDHDWNERITRECYAPNAAARILDEAGWILRIVNNYAGISFDFGPTLLSWLEDKAPAVYGTILEADRESRARFSGHGSAMAQAYNHPILPLAVVRDKRTQILWGIRDFERRFGRAPEGMWLPETAVDLESLDIMAEQGIKFTILAPHQAKRIRALPEGPWTDVPAGTIDPTRAYDLRLHLGRRLAIFFYDAPVSRAVAFEGLLSSGDQFVRRLLAAFAGERTGPQLVHIATDGETYGHHHDFGEMALAYALQRLRTSDAARLTNYGEFLERHPPSEEVEIFENTSWSCAHGVERWRSDCGCRTGGDPGWNQAWRAPLREALDWLRDRLAPLFEQAGGRLFKDPWAARDGYIDLVLDRGPDSVRRFFERRAARELGREDRVRALKLLELQRQALLMFTSCGWFFDDLSGIETVQVIRYAGRAIELAAELFNEDLEPLFLEKLGRARSNVAERGDGRRVYREKVKPARAEAGRVAAHYAARSFFEPWAARERGYGYVAEGAEARLLESGPMKFACGRVILTSVATTEAAEFGYAVVRSGGFEIHGGIGVFAGAEAFRRAADEAEKAFAGGDLPALFRTIETKLGRAAVSLDSLFGDERRRVLGRILSAGEPADPDYCGLIFERRASLLRFLAGHGAPLPESFRAAAEIVLQGELRAALAAPDAERIQGILADAANLGLDADGRVMAGGFRDAVRARAEAFLIGPDDQGLLRALLAAVEPAAAQPFPVDFREAQDVFFRASASAFPRIQKKAAEGDAAARLWIDLFARLGEKLRCRITSS